MFVAVASLLLLLLPLVKGLCYTPDGSLSNDVACNPSDEHSICCTAGFLCMSNGLCQVPGLWDSGDDKFIRGTCTDKSWGAPECRGFCVTENPSGGEWVMRCANSTDDRSDSWCCADDKCCGTGSTKLTIGDAEVTATAGERETTTSAASSSIKTDFSTVTDEPTSTPTDDGLTSETGSPEEAGGEDANESGPNTLAIGLGVGLGVGVAAIALAVGLWFWCRRRRQTTPELPSGGIQGGQYYAAEPKYAHEVAPTTIVEANGDYDWNKVPGHEGRSPVELPGGEREDAFRRRF